MGKGRRREDDDGEYEGEHAGVSSLKDINPIRLVCNFI